MCCLQVLSHRCMCVLEWSPVPDAVGMQVTWNECDGDPWRDWPESLG